MGAPKGNKNALTHGIYSTFIAVADDKDLAGMSDKDPADELALARVRLKGAMKEYAQAQGEDRLNWDAAVRHYIKIILDAKTAIIHNPLTEANVWVCWLDALRSANDRQKVQR